MFFRLVTWLSLGLAAGCVGPHRQEVLPPPVPASVPIGDVLPPPTGCVSMTFVAVDDESRAVRNKSGRIDLVITPSGRREPVLARMDLDEVEELLGRITAALTTGDSYALEHIPIYQREQMIPGPAAWEYLRRYLAPTDAVWSFGDSDTGVAVIRDNRLFCVVVVAQKPAP